MTDHHAINLRYADEGKCTVKTVDFEWRGIGWTVTAAYWPGEDADILSISLCDIPGEFKFANPADSAEFTKEFLKWA
jgi:hypothetical protein